MDAVSRPASPAFAKALASQDAILAAFAREADKKKNSPDEKVIFNAAFQMLIAAQKNIDQTRDAALPEGLGQQIDTTA